MEDMELFNYLGNIITNSGECTKEKKAMIAIVKIALWKNKKCITDRLTVLLRKRLSKNYIWIMAMYGAETCTIGYRETNEMWIQRGMQNITWTNIFKKWDSFEKMIEK